MIVRHLDVNVLVALSWPGHQFHDVVERWFESTGSKGWATSPIVETGFVRILSNPAFSRRAVTPVEAIDALRITLEHPGHQFWADDISVPEGLVSIAKGISGHQLVTDAYLVALAIHHRGKRATLDQRIAHFAPAGVVEIIS